MVLLYLVYLCNKIIKINIDMISENLRKLLFCLIKNDVIVTSWGLTDINISESKLIFSVNGFKYRGKVKIEVSDCTDFYNIYFEGNDMEKCDIVQIISFLDMKIENDVSNYHKLSQKIFKDNSMCH